MPINAKLPDEELDSTSIFQNHDPSDASPKAGLGELSLALPTAPSQPAFMTPNAAPKRKRAETHSDAIEGTQYALMENWNDVTTNRVQNINVSDQGRVHVGNTNYYNIPKMNEECLRYLHVINPETQKKHIEKTKGGLLKASYDWIIEHNDFKAFRKNPERRLLWIKGDPGKGKTMLLCGIIDELSKEPTQLTSFYFCQATDTKLGKATSVVRGLIWLLCKKKPELVPCIRAKYDIEGKEIFDGLCALESLEEILTNIIKQPVAQNAILIVDALDECADDERRDLINLILKLSSTAHAKWIVSSRNWTKIEEQFLLTSNIRIVLELNKDAIAEAVKVYIQKKVDGLSHIKRYDAKTKKAVFETLLDKSENTFLWVGLACQQLLGVKARHTMAKLHSVQPGLKQLYERMLEQIWASEDCDLCREVLAIACIAYRPVAVDELCVLAPQLKGFDSEELEEIVKECGSFLAVETGVVNFVHQTAKDFLMCKTEQIFRSGIADHHRILFQRSMVALAGLKRNMYNLKHLGILLKEVACPDPDPLSHIRYSTTYWIDHLEQVEQKKLSDDEAVERFVKTKFLTWLEAMSLQGKMFEAGAALVKLREIMRNTTVCGLKDLVEDGQRFAFYHRSEIEIAPLQVYASALLFSPANSLIRKLFEEDELDWIALKPRVDKNWDGCIQSVECVCKNPVHSMVVSADGKRLAAMTSSGVEVWEMSDSKRVGSLDFDQYLNQYSVTSIALSSDGRRLVVAWTQSSSKAEIRIWDVSLGAFVHTIHGHERSINDVVFSPDGTLLATCSDDTTIKIWDSDTTRCIRTLYGHEGEMYSLSFSANGRQLASLSFSTNGRQQATFTFDDNVSVWDVATGKRTMTLSVPLCTPFSSGRDEMWAQSMRLVVFLEADLLAAASMNEIRIWDTTTGTCIRTIDHDGNRESEVASVMALGNDGRLASTDYYGNIKVWNKKGAWVQTLHAQTDGGRAVVALSNGDLIASDHGRNIIRYWDVSHLKSAQNWQNSKTRHYERFRVKLSPDGRWLMSDGGYGWWGEMADIWDASNGTGLFRTEYVRTGADCEPTFSPDGRWFLCPAMDETLGIWNIANFELALTIRMVIPPLAIFHSRGQVLFSPNGQLLAVFSPADEPLESQSGNGTIEVWEIETCTCIHTFKASASSMEFSSDNNCLACATRWQVAVWDISKGELNQIFQHQTNLSAESPGQPIALSMNANLLAAALGGDIMNVWNIGIHTPMISIRTTMKWHQKPFSIALSPNGKWIVSSAFRGLWVWNVNTGAPVLHVDIPRYIQWFRFGTEGSQLHTPFQIIDLDELLMPRAEENDMFQTLDYGGYYYEDGWIMRGDERVICLPSEYQASERLCVDGRSDGMGSTLVIGNGNTKRFLLMRFK